MSELHPEINVDLTLKDNLIQALKTITKVSAYADEEKKLIDFAKFCLFKEPKMNTARYYIDAENTEFNMQMGITICPSDFNVHDKRTKAPKQGTWVRLSELNERNTMSFIVGSGASCWVNVLAVHVDNDKEINTENLRLLCITQLDELYIGQLTKTELKCLSGIADNYWYNNKKLNIASPEAKNWYICPIAEDVE